MTRKLFDILYVAVYSAPTMKAQPKQTVERDKKYLDYIRSLPCTVCKCPAPSHAHHHPLEGHSSVGLKTSDFRTVPLCFRCHDRVHRSGRVSFWGNTDVEVVISKLNVDYFLRS